MCGSGSRMRVPRIRLAFYQASRAKILLPGQRIEDNSVAEPPQPGTGCQSESVPSGLRHAALCR
jgi:hypothetical protein